MKLETIWKQEKSANESVRYFPSAYLTTFWSLLNYDFFFYKDSLSSSETSFTCKNAFFLEAW